MSLNILFINHIYNSISGLIPMSGAASCTVEMAEHLQKQGFNTTIAGILHEKENYHQHGVKYYHLGSNYDLSNHLSILSKEKFDVIQVLRGGCLQEVSEYFPKAKKIVRLVDVFFKSHKTFPFVINKFADTVIAVSSYVKESAIKWGINEDKINIVPVGVRTDIFCRMPDVYREKKLLVFAGATIPEKGIYLLLKSFLGILSPYPDARLEVYGAAHLWGLKEVVPWKDIERRFPNITYKGVYSKEELSKVFNRSTICIVPSLIPEGFARVSIEAQACGCPVVCTAAGGLPETIIDGETGYVVNQSAHKNFADTIINMLSDENRLEIMSGQAADNARKFSTENAARIFIKLLE